MLLPSFPAVKPDQSGRAYVRYRPADRILRYFGALLHGDVDLHGVVTCEQK